MLKRTGVVLQRGTRLEGDLSVQLFLKESGTMWVYIPGAAKGSVRFGGSLEPLVWGHYQFYQSKKRIYLKEVEVTEDFWELRSRPTAIRYAMKWGKLLGGYLIPGYPYDDLLSLFYWATKSLLSDVDPEIVHSRFIWKWLYSWGIAPDLLRCTECGGMLGEAAVWQEGSLFCRKCAKGEHTLQVQPLADYIYSKSFVTNRNIEQLLAQARAISPFLVKNLEENR